MKVNVFVKRDDLTHPEISGNKYRKLKYNLIEAERKGFSNLLSFGGAYSNHIYALASAAYYSGLKTTIFVRGDELTEESSPTLKFAFEKDAELVFVSREAYRNKEDLAVNYKDTHYLIPEGGSNELALKGVSEMVDEILSVVRPDFICCAAGTGGTLSGIASNSSYKGQILGIPVLKGGSFITDEMKRFLGKSEVPSTSLFTEYHFGGYARTNPELQAFIERMLDEHNLPLEHVYTGKLFYGIFDQISKGYFPENSTIVIIHTGGLQKNNPLNN